jgi:hypothetical protein
MAKGRSAYLSVAVAGPHGICRARYPVRRESRHERQQVVRCRRWGGVSNVPGRLGTQLALVVGFAAHVELSMIHSRRHVRLCRVHCRPACHGHRLLPLLCLPCRGACGDAVRAPPHVTPIRAIVGPNGAAPWPSRLQRGADKDPAGGASQRVYDAMLSSGCWLWRLCGCNYKWPTTAVVENATIQGLPDRWHGEDRVQALRSRLYPRSACSYSPEHGV